MQWVAGAQQMVPITVPDLSEWLDQFGYQIIISAT